MRLKYAISPLLRVPKDNAKEADGHKDDAGATSEADSVSLNTCQREEERLWAGDEGEEKEELDESEESVDAKDEAKDKAAGKADADEEMVEAAE